VKQTTVYFVRHGEVYNPKDIVYLRTPRVHLSERGVQEVEATAQFLRHEPVRMIYSSPMLRARQTAAIIQNFHPAAPVHISKFINEIKSSWQGTPRTEMDAINWNFYDNRQNPDDESRENVLARIQKQVRLTLRRNAGESVVWVAHGDIVIIASLWGRGQPLSAIDNYRGPTYIGHASVTRFVFEPGRDLPVSVDYFEPNKIPQRVLRNT
jgi:broad specificity phosphatase PhoE